MSLRRTIKQDNFDTVLEPAQAGRPAKLTIRIQVTLIPRDPRARYHAGPGNHVSLLARQPNETVTGWVEDGNQNLYQCRSWTEAEFNAFKIKFKQMVEVSWNNQLILVPTDAGPEDGGLSDQDYLQLVNNPQVPAHVEGALEVELMPASRVSQTVMEAARLAKRENYAFRSYQHIITNEDIEFASLRDSRWPSLRFNQVAAAHEVGHWLSDRLLPLDDPDRYFSHTDAEYCSKLPNHESNDDCEYGHTPSKRTGLMGAGSVVTEYEAKPWLFRLMRHTRVLFGWQYVHRINFANGAIPVSVRQQRLTGGARVSAGAGR